MKVLVTGASGFLGKYIVKELEGLKYDVDTIGRDEKSTIKIDLSKEILELSREYDLVVHVAGKAHQESRTKDNELSFFKINHNGTINLLNSLKENLPNTFIFISSVAVYGIEYGENIDEEYPLNGGTPYAKSKILAEKEIINFSERNDINYVILRLPLISGKTPPGNLKSMINAINKGYYFRIGDGSARKSMVSALDVAKLIPNLYARKGIYNITDRVHPSFKEIENFIAKKLNRKIISLPKIVFVFLAKVGDLLPVFIINTNKLKKITKPLIFSDNKAVKELKWKPSPALEALKFK